MVIFRMVNNTFTGPLYPLSRSGLLIVRLPHLAVACVMHPSSQHLVVLLCALLERRA